MDRKYYSQFGEDFLLWQVFDGASDGFFVDVGAFDGLHLSNSYSFEREGWTGVCVEPHPGFFEECERNRPESVCLNFACIGDGATDEVNFLTEDLGLLSGITIDDEDVRARYENRGLDFDGLKKVCVPARTLDAILAEHLPVHCSIDFASIDVEGTELDVLKGFDLNRYEPRVLVVEANDEASHSQITDYLTARGYIEARAVHDLNYFFARDPEDARVLARTDIECEIEKVLHPGGEAYTLDWVLHESGRRKTERQQRERSFVSKIKSRIRRFLS